MTRIGSVLMIAFLTIAGSARTVSAQDPNNERGPRVSGAFGGAHARSASDFSFAGSLGYRFDRFLGLELEVTGMPDIGTRDAFGAREGFGAWEAFGSRGAFGAFPPSRVPIERDARGVFFTANLRSEIPTGRRWLIPYVVAGGGIASLRERVDIGAIDDRQLFSQFERMLPQGSGGSIPPGVFQGRLQSTLQSLTFPVVAQGVSSTTTDLTLSFGGGVSFLVVKGLSLDADVRYYRVFADTEFNVVRFGTGASYRF